MASMADTGWEAMEAKPKGSASLAAVISAFVPTWATGLVFVAIFILIRHRYPNIYAPRTFMGTIPQRDRTPSASASQAYFDWVHTMSKLSDKFLLYHHSLDTYLYMRFLRTIIFICIVGCCLTWPVLMPVNAAGGGTSTQIDKIGIGNVSKKSYLYAHAVMAWVFLGFVMFTIARERIWLIGLRQAWTLSTSDAKRLSSRTVLYLSAPRDALEESNMHRLFGDGAVRIWPVTQAEALETLVSERSSLVGKLEGAEMALIRKANKKGASKNVRSQVGDEPTYDSLPDAVKKSIRPMHRLKFSPASEKVDSIEWLREQIKDKEGQIEEMRASYKIENPHGAAAVFVEFRTHADAQRASQQVASSNLLALTPRYAGVLPKDVIWDNLTIPPARRISQEGIAHAIVIASIVFWSIPSGFVGLVSNISYLAENFEWLSFLKNLPEPLIGLLSGLLPPLLTSLLSKYVPNLYRYIFKSFGAPTTVANEIKVQKWFQVYQVTQVFLVTAVFSGAATVASQLIEGIQDPASIPALLARQLPKSSNYYLTYFIIQGTTSATDNLLNYSDLLQYLFFDYFFDKTPRQKFTRYTSMKGITWGKVFPKFANFAIIAIAYSCIAPLVLGFAGIGLGLYYFSYRYNLLYVIQPKIDTKGQAYTLALQHLLTGVYIAELALIGIFGLSKATGPSIMLAVLFIVTILYNVLMNKYLSPLEKFLPSDLASASEEGDESTPLLSGAEEGRSQMSSHIQRLGQRAHVPSHVSQHVVDPTARFFEPHVFATYESMKTWVHSGDHYDIEEDEVPEYKEEQLKKAYLNPALTSPTPLIWLARDGMGASKSEVQENGERGLKASDEGAWIDEKGRVKWSVQEIGKVPVWKQGVKY
ncbi:Uu.00g123660.m01.CDS01 [Anthostomella pinea]|uniref:Uu.00g123660.m01.CDS01 n=1 Tax=Anthostomella pinea TaxID=933095 RepID=A0AAI8VC58_9PEZI|nr:Uu.00g123660.m01.CDS01 [Anthostomella pinea]